MRLLDLEPSVQRHLSDGHLTVGHGKAILGLKEAKSQVAAAEHILRKNLTVRASERFVQDFNKQKRKKSPSSTSTPADIQLLEIQNKLREHFSTHVQITPGKKKGRIDLEYYGDDDLERILDLLGITVD